MADVTRKQLYGAFGPVFLEAFMDLVLEQFNTLRAEHSLSQFTKQQLANALKNKLDTLDPDWNAE